MKCPACSGSENLRSNSFHGLRSATWKLRLWALLALLALGLPAVSAAVGRPWILVDTKTLTLTVYSSGNRVLARFHNIAIGSGGAAEIHRHGDETTPLGVFRVAWIDRHSRFGTFYGVDYPTARVARRAYTAGDISAAQLRANLAAARAHRVPPQNTPLGGQLGIHGIGAGDPRVQRNINWTNGCVALSNGQIKRLSPWLRVGTKVVIR